jgi:serine protease Do
MNDRYADAWGIKNKNGAIVQKVTAGGPAEASGIKRSDIIIAVNDEEVKDRRQLTQRVGSLLAGTTNKFRIIRDGKEQTILVTVRERDEGLLNAQNDGDPKRKNMLPPKQGPEDVTVHGGTMRPLTPTEAGKFDVEAPGTGLMIVTVKARGALAKMLILPGDVILAVNNKAVKTPKDYEDAVVAARAAGKKDIIARIQCGRQERCGDQAALYPVEVQAE